MLNMLIVRFLSFPIEFRRRIPNPTGIQARYPSVRFWLKADHHREAAKRLLVTHSGHNARQVCTTTADELCSAVCRYNTGPGSFKFRGAYNKLSRLSSDELAAGVVTDSSGNHVQGIAAVAQMLGAPATKHR